MLKLNPDPTFKADVAITVPGQSEPGTISLTFKYRSRKEYADFLNWLKGDDVADEVENDEEAEAVEKVSGKTTAEAFPEFVSGWKGMNAKFTPENIEIFLDNYPAAYMEIFSQYSKLLLASRVKN